MPRIKDHLRYNYKNLLVSKYSEKSPDLKKIKKFKLFLSASAPFKLVYKNILWLFFLIIGIKPELQVFKKKRQSTSKTLLTLFYADLKNKLNLIDKIIFAATPNLENKIDRPSKLNSFSFFMNDCMSYSEIGIKSFKKMEEVLKKFNIGFFINWTIPFNKKLFFMQTINLPFVLETKENPKISKNKPKNVKKK